MSDLLRERFEAWWAARNENNPYVEGVSWLAVQALAAAAPPPDRKSVPPAAPQPAEPPIHYHTTILWDWGEEQVPCKRCGWPLVSP